MRHCTRWKFSEQIDWLRRQFAQTGQMPFAEILSNEVVLTILKSLDLNFFNSLYNPLTTLWLFLNQVISANPTLGNTVGQFLAWRLGQGMSPCASDTGAYAKARRRLPEALLAKLVQHTGSEADRTSPEAWRWLGHVVKVFDGSTVSMPDTPQNQAAFPQSSSQKKGIGFPMARIGVLFSLSVATVLNLSIRRYAGKLQSELAMLREMIPDFQSGEVLLADRLLCCYMEIALLQQQCVHFVGRIHASRRVDFRRGQHLGREDHIVEWSKPQRPEWMTREQYATMPDTMLMREFRYRIVRRGYRTKKIVVATTLLDAAAYSVKDIAELYRRRWEAELNLRSLKTMMNMEVLRCQTPEMVRKEIWAHLLAYNLIRAVIAQAALKHGREPRQISFTRAMRMLEAFRPTLAHATSNNLNVIYAELLKAIADNRVGNRPDRIEPRKRKRRPKEYPLLTQPRETARKQEAKTR